MSNPETLPELLVARRPKRADAMRNHEKLVSAAREAFADGGGGGGDTSLEEIARRAGVGIATLYRNFPTRQDLLEAVYVDEVVALCRSAEDLATMVPWDALVAWLRRFVRYLATKRALAEDLLAYVDRDAEFFRACRTAFYGAAEPLLGRAQAAGAVRPDATFDEVIQMVSAIARITPGDPAQVERILDIALDGLRYTPAGR